MSLPGGQRARWEMWETQQRQHWKSRSGAIGADRAVSKLELEAFNVQPGFEASGSQALHSKEY